MSRSAGRHAMGPSPAYLAAVCPLGYLAWLESARRGHVPCSDPDCPLCNPIRELIIPLPEELEEVMT